MNQENIKNLLFIYRVASATRQRVYSGRVFSITESTWMLVYFAQVEAEPSL